ncbi:hypothetical protein [Bradyrhizobium sp. CCBAU 45384]|uniref:hypothetical protein n=1 Tax=Bradyrhizobium sp. CCBAU 45384 TaxID=858428 RepID=UPI00230649A6|nr:hypothetical protein [Bradyrhizobium sp. CCBAU 45384]
MPELRDYISNIEFATSLRELRSAVVDAYDFLGQQDLGDLDDYVSMSALPTFGGEKPNDTNEVWSWDADELMVTGPDGDFAIVERQVWADIQAGHNAHA